MKKFISLVVLFSFLITTCTQAQTKAENAVARAAEKLRLAMISGDQKELESIVAKKLSYGHSGGYVEDKKEFIDKLVTKKSDFVGISIDDQVVSVTHKTAIVRHILSAQTNDNNKPGRVKLKVMLVFVKINGHWKLAARQAVKPI
ncbi:MAG TPA: nuclear transport factor 2 family protein [Ferruginibacter sp.]|nr:nuclear transport factor 2 family protein [Ferruginibacter sp.]